MADDTTGGESPLQVVETYSGKLFWLNPPSGKSIDLEALKESLQERAFEEDISEEFDNENVVIPEVFSRDGQMVRTTTIEDVILVTFDGKDVVVGDIVLDNVNRIIYRDNEILVLDTAKASFLIFEEDNVHYLCILAKRDLAKTIVGILREEFTELGSIINHTRLGSDAISHVRDSLDAVLMDTIITDYDQTEITQTRIQGEDYEDTHVYDSIDSGGRVKSHMFQTDQLVPEETKTILVGRDGLVRIYSNATLQTYLLLLQNHVIPEIHHDIESSPSVGAWGAVSADGDSIFEDSS